MQKKAPHVEGLNVTVMKEKFLIGFLKDSVDKALMALDSKLFWDSDHKNGKKRKLTEGFVLVFQGIWKKFSGRFGHWMSRIKRINRCNQLSETKIYPHSNVYKSNIS